MLFFTRHCRGKGLSENSMIARNFSALRAERKILEHISLSPHCSRVAGPSTAGWWLCRRRAV
jgi:hypothetical protein